LAAALPHYREVLGKLQSHRLIFGSIVAFAELVHRTIDDLPVLARFAILLALMVSVPQLSRRIRLPGAVGLLLSGVVLGPHVLDVFPPQHPVTEFFSELGMLLLMFFAGLEMNLPLFREKIFRSIVFGITTTSIPPSLLDVTKT
jgi:Kef-type K+ transport system membrane component KefB